MNKNKGIIGIGLILAIVLGIVVVGGGAYYLGKGKDKKGEESLNIENKIKEEQYKFAFYDQNNKLYISSVGGEVSLLGSNIKIKKDELEHFQNYSYSVMPKDVLEGMNISKPMGFYSAIQSMDNKNMWIFTERYEFSKDIPYSQYESGYNLYFYNHETKNKEFIFSQEKSPDPKYSFVPFVWNKDIIYLEAKVFGSSTENEGIWSYNIITKQFTKIEVNPLYLTTPVISPDGKYFAYIGTIENKNLDSSGNIIFIYNLVTNQEKIVTTNNNTSFDIYGWINAKSDSKDIIEKI